MKMNKVAASAACIFLSLLTGVCTADTIDSAIQLTPRQLYCRRDRPWVTFGMYVLGQDSGRPGAAYVGAHDPEKKHGAYMTGDGNWYSADGASLVPAYADLRSGMRPVIFDFPLDLSSMDGWSIYVGYGVLTQADESAAARLDADYERLKAKVASMGRSMPVPDGEQFKRMRVQNDMTMNKKYQAAANMSMALRDLCRPCYEPGNWGSYNHLQCSHPTVTF